MPVRRKAKDRRERWHDGHESQLLDGVDWFGDAWGDDPTPSQLEEMREAWQQHGERLLRDFIYEHPGSRPWAWWRWDAPEPRNSKLPEPEQLNRLGLLPAEECGRLRQIEADPARPQRPFRRPWSWWHAHPQRDWAKPEAIQLVELNALNDRERDYLDDPSQVATEIILLHSPLTAAEIEFLKRGGRHE